MKTQNLMKMTGLAATVLLSTATLLTGLAGASSATMSLPRPPHAPIIKG